MSPSEFSPLNLELKLFHLMCVYSTVSSSLVLLEHQLLSCMYRYHLASL